VIIGRSITTKWGQAIAKPSATLYRFNEFILAKKGESAWKQRSRNKTNEFEELSGPNLSPNLDIQTSPHWVLKMTAIFSILLQGGIPALAGLTANPYRERFRKNGQLIPGYGFPFTLVGTIDVCCGMFTCARPIDRSTYKRVWVKEKNKLKTIEMHVLGEDVRPGENTIGHKLDWLAMGIEKCGHWEVIGPDESSGAHDGNSDLKWFFTSGGDCVVLGGIFAGDALELEVAKVGDLHRDKVPRETEVTRNSFLLKDEEEQLPMSRLAVRVMKKRVRLARLTDTHSRCSWDVDTRKEALKLQHVIEGLMDVLCGARQSWGKVGQSCRQVFGVLDAVSIRSVAISASNPSISSPFSRSKSPSSFLES
jgi:hypothetical protein